MHHYKEILSNDTSFSFCFVKQASEVAHVLARFSFLD